MLRRRSRWSFVHTYELHELVSPRLIRRDDSLGAQELQHTVVGGALGWLLHGDADAYRYIPASIRTYPTAQELVHVMQHRGFSRVAHYPLLGGLMAIHQAMK